MILPAPRSARRALRGLTLAVMLPVAGEALALDASILRAEHFLRAGIRAFQEGDLDGAERSFLRARSAAPELPEPRILLGHVHMVRAEFASAEAAYAEGILRFRRSPRSVRDGGPRWDTPTRTGGMWSAAAGGTPTPGPVGPARLEIVVAAPTQEEPNVPAELYFHLGRARLLGGRTDAAVEALRQAAGLAPESAGVRLHLAMALAAQGQLEAARDECRIGATLGHPQAAALEGRLDQAAATWRGSSRTAAVLELLP